MFLAIAVDNLANAQELTAAEEEQEEQVECTMNNSTHLEHNILV